MDFERARFNMVEQQIRPWEVLDRTVLDLMERAPRDAFVPNEYRRLAYADTAVPIGHGEAMLPPKVEGRLFAGTGDRARGTGARDRRRQRVSYLAARPACGPRHRCRAETCARGAGPGEPRRPSRRKRHGGGRRRPPRSGPGCAVRRNRSRRLGAGAGAGVRGAACGRRPTLRRDRGRAGDGSDPRAAHRRTRMDRKSMFETVLPPLAGADAPGRFVL